MRISTIIPCYNGASYLGEALTSAFGQSRHSSEIIVVDDFSTDGSAQVAEQFGVRVLRTQLNSGHAAARNIGIEAAKGDMIAWLDADDYWEPNHLEVVAGLLERHPEAAVAYSSVRCFGTKASVWRASHANNQPTDVFGACLEGTIVPAMSAVTRRDAIRSVGGFNSSIRVAPDFDLWLRMSVQFKFVCTNEVTANYRWHSQQISAVPVMQRISMLKSRARFIDSADLAGRLELREAAVRKTLAKWDLELWDAWRQGDMPTLREIVALRPLMPGETSAYRALRRRMWLPSWAAKGLQWTKDRIRPSLYPAS